MKIQMIIMKSQQKKPHNASPHSKLFSIVVSTKKDAGSQEIAIYRETLEGQYSTNLVEKKKQIEIAGVEIFMKMTVGQFSFS